MKSNIISSIRKNHRKVIIGVIIAAVVIFVGILSYYIYEDTYYVYTDDAKVTADLIDVSPQISGKLIEFDIKEGDVVTKDQILARLDSEKNLGDSDIDQSLVRAPISGIVAKKQVNIGQNISPNKTIALLADPDDYYITANIDETKVSKLNVGQSVCITVDEYGRQKFTGNVSFISKISQSKGKPSSYSLNGKYKKTVQKIPVKIKLKSSNNSGNLDNKFIIGGSAKVKIRIK